MFQHFMNDILREYLDVIAVGILDDVIIFSEDPSHGTTSHSHKIRLVPRIDIMLQSVLIASKIHLVKDFRPP